MGVMKDEHKVTISGTEVAVIGETGLVEATWRLLIGGEEADSARASGDFRLKGRLTDGSLVEALVHQGAFGPTAVDVEHDGNHVVHFTGFVI